MVTLEHEKGKAANWDSRVFTFPPESISGFEALLQKWEQFRDVRGTRARAPTDSYYLLPWESRKTFPSTQIDTWLKEILSHLGVAPPDGEQWSGHSLRKGAASGAAAIGAPLNRICWCGGWSQTSRAVHDYIDPTVVRARPRQPRDVSLGGCASTALTHELLDWQLQLLPPLQYGCFFDSEVFDGY